MSNHTRNPGAPEASWKIKEGQQLKRPEIHAVYGGRPSPAISPCKSTSSNILLFATPQPYPGCLNEWIDSRRFNFYGEGASGTTR